MRGQGLGALAALDDATLLSVLACCGARDLARLSQCSRALAVYADHEPLWKDLLLTERGGDWTWRGNYRDTYSGRQHRPFPVQGLYSDLLNKSWVCATAQFNRAWLGVDTVPREQGLVRAFAAVLRVAQAPHFASGSRWTISCGASRSPTGP